MKIRKAEKKDIPRILALLGQVLQIHAEIRPDIFIPGTTKYTPCELTELLQQEDHPIYVAVDEDDLCMGYAFCQLKKQPFSTNMVPFKSLFIDDLCVDKQTRGQHIGESLFDYVKQASYLLRILTLNTYLVILFCLAFFKIYPQQIYEILSLVITLLTLLAAINIWILYYDQRTRLQQQEIDSYQKNMPIYDSLIHEIRANQHEYANHLQSLANLSVMYKDYDSLSRALQSYSQEFSNPMANYPLLQINMPLLAASLYSMASHAQEKGIALQFDIVNAVLESHAPEHALTDYITILTQNAIEACKAGDTVYALLDSKDGSVRYEIRNPVPAMISPEEIGNFFKRGYSTKQTQADSDAASKQASSDATSKQADDKRGLGLYYLQTNVTKSGGSVGADCVCYEDSYFIIFRLTL